MAKPTNLFRWASAGGAAITEPLAALKDTGFPASPSAYVLVGELLNWLFNGAYQWFAWLDAFLDTVHTWTRTQTFTPDAAGPDGTGVIANGVTVSGTANSAVIATATRHALLAAATGTDPTIATTSSTGGGSGIKADATGSAAAVEATSVTGAALKGTSSGAGPGLYARSSSAAGYAADIRNTAGAGGLALLIRSDHASAIGAEGDTSTGGVISAYNDASAPGGSCFQASNGTYGLDAGSCVIPLKLGTRTSDPSSPAEGSLWLDRNTNQLCAVLNGTIRRVTLT